MPVIGLVLHFAAAVLFAVHALRTGQDRYWLFILFVFPVLGSLVYAFAIWLPEMRHSRGARRLTHGVQRIIDPGRELREARQAMDTAPTASNRLRLADALLGDGQTAEAVQTYEQALQGLYQNDPDIEVRLAHALLESGRARAARERLDALIARAPDFRSPEGHLTYARALAAEGERERAREEFQALLSDTDDFRTWISYLQCLVDWDDVAEARGLCTELLRQVSRMPKYARRINADAIRRLKQVAGRLDGARS